MKIIKKSQAFLMTLIILSTLALMGCGKDPTPNSPNLEKPTTKDVSVGSDPEKRLAETIENYNVSCENPSECPEYMAMLALEDKDDLGFIPGYRCSSFLIGEDVLATNAHCIPGDLSAGDSCKDRIFALFPKSRGKKALTVNCQKVLSKFKDNNLGYDYAFIKLEKNPGRTIPEIDFSGRANSMEVTLWKVNPKESYYGLIKKATCNLIDDSLFSLENFHSPPFSPSFSHSGCESVPGNSGSPVLSEDGKIIGIHWGGRSNWDQTAEVYKDLIPDGVMETVDVSTNFSCLCKNGDAYTHLCENTPISCKKSTDDLAYQKNSSEFFMEQGKKFLSAEDLALAEKATQSFSSNSVEFKWGFTKKIVYDGEKPLSYHLLAGLTPKCVKDSKNLWEDSLEWISEGKVVRTVFFIGIPLCEIDLTLNSKLQVTGMKLDKSKCFEGSFYLDFSGTQQEIENLENRPLKVAWGPYQKDGYVLPSTIDLNIPKCEGQPSSVASE